MWDGKSRTHVNTKNNQWFAGDTEIVYSVCGRDDIQVGKRRVAKLELRLGNPSRGPGLRPSRTAQLKLAHLGHW